MEKVPLLTAPRALAISIESLQPQLRLQVQKVAARGYLGGGQ
jgi:hypothetical protein